MGHYFEPVENAEAQDTLPPAGKIPYELFAGTIRPHLGTRHPEVLVGPRHGVDAGIVQIGDTAMAVTTDPFFVAPEYGWERAAWFAVHIVASDAATSGLRPRYLTVDLNLPPDLSDADFAALWTAVDRTCRDLDLSIVTGHTGRYDNCAFPMLGGATVMSVGPLDGWITPAMALVGDAVLITKGAAIETTALLATAAPGYIARQLGAEIAREAGDLFHRMSIVEDAMLAAGVGVRDRGVTGMHDATERGVWNALHEISEASGHGLLIEQGEVPVLPATRAVCELFGVDPYASSSEGTLVLTCRPQHVRAVLERLDGAGILSRQIGEVVPADMSVRLVRDGREGLLPRPDSDPFWPAYLQAMEEEGR